MRERMDAGTSGFAAVPVASGLRWGPRGCRPPVGVDQGSGQRILDVCVHKTCREQGWERGLAGNCNWGSWPSLAASISCQWKVSDSWKRVLYLERIDARQDLPAPGTRAGERDPSPLRFGQGRAERFASCPRGRAGSVPRSLPSVGEKLRNLARAGKAWLWVRSDEKRRRQKIFPTGGPAWKRGGLLHSAISGWENPLRGLEQEHLGPHPAPAQPGEGLGALLGPAAAPGRTLLAAGPRRGSRRGGWQVSVACGSPKRCLGTRQAALPCCCTRGELSRG